LIDNIVVRYSVGDGLVERCQVTLPYKTFDHTADLGVEISGADPPQLFANAGTTLFHLISGSSGIEEHAALPVTVEGSGYEDLMMNWLRELLYLHQVKGYLLSTFIIHALDESVLEATVRGEPFDARRHELRREIKAVTYHQLSVKREPTGWTARIVFDI
jgi:SHS2 domain-containing protein